MRNQFGGHAVHTDAPRPRRHAEQADPPRRRTPRPPRARARPRARRPPDPARLPLLRPSRGAARAGGHRVRRAATGRARPTSSRRSTTSPGSSSHRVACDAPLVRQGAEQAVVRAAVVKDGRKALLEVEINPGRSNRARVNRSPLPRARDLLGLVRTVLFSPEDLRPGEGRPRPSGAGSSTTSWCCAPRARRRPGRLRPGARAAQRPAQERRGGAAAAARPRRALRQHAGGVGRPAGRARRRAGRGPGSPWWPSWSRWSADAYAAVAKDGSPRRRRPSLPAVLRPRPVPGDRPRPDSPAGRRFLDRARAPPRARRCSAGSPWSGRTATSWRSASGRCRSRATPRTASPGRSRSRCGWRPTTCSAPTATTRS